MKRTFLLLYLILFASCAFGQVIQSQNSIGMGSGYAPVSSFNPRFRHPTDSRLKVKLVPWNWILDPASGKIAVWLNSVAGQPNFSNEVDVYRPYVATGSVGAWVPPDNPGGLESTGTIKLNASSTFVWVFERPHDGFVNQSTYPGAWYSTPTDRCLFGQSFSYLTVDYNRSGFGAQWNCYIQKNIQNGGSVNNFAHTVVLRCELTGTASMTYSVFVSRSNERSKPYLIDKKTVPCINDYGTYQTFGLMDRTKSYGSGGGLLTKFYFYDSALTDAEITSSRW